LEVCRVAPVVEPESDPEDDWGYSWKKVIAKYGELKGELHMVDFERGSDGLGLNLAGNRDLGIMSVFVVGIQPDSSVASDGRIRVGDELLEINGQVLHGRSHLNASAIIKSINTNKIKVILLRREDYLLHMAVKPLKLPPVAFKADPSTLIENKLPKNQAKSIDQTSIDEGDDESLSEAPTENHVAPTPQNDTSLDKFPNAKTVELAKGNKGLGFAIQEGSTDGQAGIYVKTVTPGSVAAESGKFQVGDQVLSVDNQSIVEATYDKALELLRKTRGTVTLVINKCPPPVTDNNNKPPATMTKTGMDVQQEEIVPAELPEKTQPSPPPATQPEEKKEPVKEEKEEEKKEEEKKEEEKKEEEKKEEVKEGRLAIV
jgi:C-terminal processing protease CtpA/Prc